MISAQIIADSINEYNCRLTTFVLEYPRFIHSEVLTHKMFSKNSASSRAIPFEKFVKQIQDNPATPEFWGKNQKGMQAYEELDNIEKDSAYYYRDYLGGGSEIVEKEYITKKEHAKRIWLEARNSAIGWAQNLHNLGLHKQIVNRILEPWFHMKVILSGTEFENFFALRAHKDAQPEFQVLAFKMLEEYNKSEPKSIKRGGWHIPFGDKFDEEKLNNLSFVQKETQRLDNSNYCGDYTSFYVSKQEAKKKIAIARCARVSYLNFEGKDDYEADINLCDKLFSNIPLHLSPAEHVAQSQGSDKFVGNFRGWKQCRKFFKNENLTDDRVIRKIYKREKE